MKRINLLLVVTVLLFAACTGRISEGPSQDSWVIQQDAFSDYDYQFGCTTVSLEDVRTYSSSFSGATKAGEAMFEIEPFVDEENDTLFYVVKFEKGFKVIASDRRVYPILIEEEESSYEDMLKNDPARLWMQIMAAEMKVLKHTPDEDLLKPAEEIEYYQKLWASFVEPDAFLHSLLQATKGEIPIDESGQYVYAYTSTTNETVIVDHLMTTTWHQGSDYNYYCPYRTDITTNRAPAGSEAVAAAQVLYYLHNLWGVPTQAPSQAYCNSSVGDDPLDMGQSSYNSTIWSSMASNSMAAAPMIANLGYLANTEYGNTESHADLLDLKNSAIGAYGISSTYGSYDATTIPTYLLDGTPIIVQAYGSISYDQGGNPVYGDSHTFVIDGYKGTRVKTTVVYQWVYDNPNQGVPLPAVPDLTYISYSPTTVQYIKMNWGWQSTTSHNTWYALNSSWLGNNNGNGHYYDYERKMLYNIRH